MCKIFTPVFKIRVILSKLNYQELRICTIITQNNCSFKYLKKKHSLLEELERDFTRRKHIDKKDLA
jgi:hypothetical protein